jgi:hypothetical protein
MTVITKGIKTSFQAEILLSLRTNIWFPFEFDACHNLGHMKLDKLQKKNVPFNNLIESQNWNACQDYSKQWNTFGGAIGYSSGKNNSSLNTPPDK